MKVSIFSTPINSDFDKQFTSRLTDNSMKDLLTSAPSPFSLANGPTTPDLHRPQTNYSPSPLHKGTSHSEGLPRTAEEENESEGLLLQKLHGVAATLDECQSRTSSPFDMIPNEILSCVLEHGYFGTETGIPDESFRTLVGNISRRFRVVTQQTPSLWSFLYLSPSNIFNEIDQLPIYLERSKSYPLDLHFSCFWGPDITDRLMKTMIPHSTRWQQLSVTVSNDHALKHLQYAAVPTLSHLAITLYSSILRVPLPSPSFNNDLPQLEYLSLRNVDLNSITFPLKNIQALKILGYGIWPSLSRLNEMIGLSTNLRHLVLHVKPTIVLAQLRISSSGTLSSDNYLGKIHLPALKCLAVYTSEGLSQDMADLIEIFNASKLELLILRKAVKTELFPIMGYAVQYKRLDPVAWQPVWRQDFTKVQGHARLDGCVGQPTLYVRSANLYYAYSALQRLAATRLTTLELNDVSFPSLVKLKEIFASLKNLKYLSMYYLAPLESFNSILGPGLSQETIGMVEIPCLSTLVISFGQLSPSGPDGTDVFLQLFNLPSLSFLLLKNLTLSRWYDVVKVFRQGGIQSYPKLTTVKLVSMNEEVPVGTFAKGNGNPVAAFPRLESLLMDDFCSNRVLECLLKEHGPTGDGEEPVWPNLTTLGITNDPSAGIPLLHRIIQAREDLSRSLKHLYLDSKFMTNLDSFEWIKQRVNVEVVVDDSDISTSG